MANQVGLFRNMLNGNLTPEQKTGLKTKTLVVQLIAAIVGAAALVAFALTATFASFLAFAPIAWLAYEAFRSAKNIDTTICEGSPLDAAAMHMAGFRDQGVRQFLLHKITEGTVLLRLIGHCYLQSALQPGRVSA